jgi:hypothetical protein
VPFVAAYAYALHWAYTTFGLPYQDALLKYSAEEPAEGVRAAHYVVCVSECVSV